MIWRLWFFRPSCFGGRGQERASDVPRFVRDEHGWEGTQKRDLATESLRKRRVGLTRARVREKALPIAIARCAADLRVRKTSWRAKRRGLRHRDCLPASTPSRRTASTSCGPPIDGQSPQALAARDRSSTPARCRRSRLRAAARRLRRVAHVRAHPWSGELFVRRAAAGVAGTATALPRLDAVVFTGGIGERSALVRASVCARLTTLGVAARYRGADRRCRPVSATGGPAVLRVESREDRVVADEVRRVLRS
jgi:Acetokinase family